jgi:CheY-like chemotaxis protein
MIDIEVYPGSHLWTVNADPVQIEQVLLNLGSNAADAMPDGGKFVILTENVTVDEENSQYHLNASPGRYVAITVSDTGGGMDQDTVAHIFDPFYTTKETGKGTGLGLASVYGVIKGHGGYIDCQSKLGQGTIFRIYLPATEKTDIEVDGEIGEGVFRGGPETVLVVDDEATIRDLTSETLERFGYKVLIATSGEEALEIYADPAKQVDLVLLDLGMPGMGGHRCLREIQRIDPAAKIVIASGYSIDGQVKKTLESGAKGFIAKPYQLIDLLSTVRTVLDSES